MHARIWLPHRYLVSLLALAPLVGCSNGDEDAPRRPNVLVISIDTLRADHVGCYGYGPDTTPTLDALAAEGVRFERCLSSTSWTLPSHLSMLTGLAISAHGIDDDRLWSRFDPEGAPIAPDLRGRFVSEALSQDGYACGGFFTWKYLDDRFGFGAGFEHWERFGHMFWSHPEIGPLWQAALESQDKDAMLAIRDAHPTLFDPFTMSTPETLAAAEGWLDGHLEANEDDPFFLFVHLFDVHDPYTAPDPYYTMFDPDYDGPITGMGVTSDTVRADMSPRDRQNLIARYDGGLRYVDDRLGEFLGRLEERGISDDTLVIVTSDHGEEFFEHGGKTHRSSLWLESIAVPLIVRWPAGIEGGRFIKGNVGLVDIVPTICAATGVELGAPTSGRDLLPIARGTAANDMQAYLSELTLFAPGARVPFRNASVVRANEQVLYRTQGRAPWSMQYLDLKLDPWGAGPGTPLTEGEQAERWQDRLSRWIQAVRDLRRSLPERRISLRPMTELERNELAAGGYSGNDEVVGDYSQDRLPLEGGVWPDE
jgi:arylsulfatase A-like enzyme